MKDSKKIRNNLVLGISGQIVALVLGILVPKLILDNYGSEINGLLSSVTNIYTYIALVEAGVAAASCQALYKTIANKDREQTCAVLSATNKYYHRTGIIYLTLVAAFSALYPLLIKSQISYATVFLVVLFNGLGNVVNYFFHGKYLILLKADGKHYIRTGLEMVTNALKQIAKIVLIALGFDVVMVQFVAMLTSLAQMLYITYYIKKHYSWLDLSVKPDKSAISQSKNVLIHEINYLITANVDTVLLTIFTTLKTVSVYALYHLLFEMINRVLRTIRDSLEFKIAHIFHTDKEKFLKVFKAFEIYYIAFAFSLFTVANYFITPFLALYTSGVTDANYLDKYLPFLFVIINLLAVGRYPSEAMVHIAGYFRQTQKSAIIEMSINLVLSIVLINIFGIYGALLGTIASLLYRANYLIIYVNKKIIGRSVWSTYKCWTLNFLIYIFITMLNKFVVIELNSYIAIMLFCIPYAIAVMGVYFIIVSISEPRSFRLVYGMICNMLNKLIIKLKKQSNFKG